MLNILHPEPILSSQMPKELLFAEQKILIVQLKYNYK